MTHSKKFYFDLLKNSQIDFDEKAKKGELVNLCNENNLINVELVEEVEEVETLEPVEIIEIETDNDIDELERQLSEARNINFENNTIEGEEKPLITRERKKRAKKDSKPDSFKLEGYILLMLVDSIFPLAISFLNNWLSKTVKVTSEELSLTDAQLKKLEPLADQAADYLSFNVNPVAGFFLVTSLSYASNLTMLRNAKK